MPGKYEPFKLELFRMGYIIQYKNSGGFIGNSIEKEQKRRGFNDRDASFTHVEISGGDQHSINIRPPKAIPIEITKAHAGRFIRLIKYKEYNDDPHERLRIKVAYFSAQLCHRGYDWLGVIKFLIPFIYHKKFLFFCSEGVAWALKKVYPLALIGIPSYETMPADFSKKEEFEIVWEGYIPASDEKTPSK